MVRKGNKKLAKQATTKAVNPQPRRRNNNRRRGMRADAPLAKASTITGFGRGTNDVHLTGMSRIAQAVIPAGTGTDGYIVVDETIVPELLPRLGFAARIFQRYAVETLEFEIQPMCPANTGGGYVAGFLPDPTDSDHTFDAIQATRGAVVAKWWESRTIRPQYARALLWTSVGKEQRLTSPGRLILLCVGNNTDVVNVSVLCRWSVRLSVPSLETPEDTFAPILTLGPLYNDSLAANDFKSILLGSTQLDIAPEGAVYSLDRPLSIDYNLGTGDVDRAVYWHVKKVAGNAGTPAGWFHWGLWDNFNKTFTQGTAYYSDAQPRQILLPVGTLFTRADSGN
ncbi:capsid protein [Atlantic cod betanodavirus Ac06NorE]|uniref:Capsid protein alpha n=6 Tax=unclassified Betanodavirus TaxID=330379 RepID=B3F5D9_9VIRU|nr:capsid protein [Atlantic cod betanodavirus Ac06NorPm]ABU95414.1 capsid protein [Atlantic cod betanodavirus Ac06NorPp]ABU95415.1 capsid protein [Atlantic cod betanodavirus Ac06NorE]ABU95416.1 capsid protein [Atlantic cod betanodavirus Ac06NorT]